MGNGIDIFRLHIQVIAVIDADAFFASCEELNDPSLIGTAFAVGLGVLTTASCSFPLSFDIRMTSTDHSHDDRRSEKVRLSICASWIRGEETMSPSKIHRCQHARPLSYSILTRPCRQLNFELYSSCSKKIMAVFERYGTTSPASLDEAYISLTAYCAAESITPSEAVQRIRAAVKEETGLTVSAGVSTNAKLSKIAADFNKPDGQYVIDPTRDAGMAFMAALPIRRVPGFVPFFPPESIY